MIYRTGFVIVGNLTLTPLQVSLLCAAHIEAPADDALKIGKVRRRLLASWFCAGDFWRNMRRTTSPVENAMDGQFLYRVGLVEVCSRSQVILTANGHDLAAGLLAVLPGPMAQKDYSDFVGRHAVASGAPLAP